jgi:hypothetical protein
MGCCGQARAIAAQNNPAPNQQVGTPGRFTKVRFTQKAAVLIRGPVTGRHYQFHEGAYTQQMDTRDAAVLVKTGYFQPELGPHD